MHANEHKGQNEHMHANEQSRRSKTKEHRSRNEEEHCVEEMGKKQNDIQKTGLGRALLSRFYRKKFLESFTEVSDIDAVVEQSLEPLPKLAAVASTTLISL